MSQSARAFWVTAPGRGQIQTVTLPPPGADAVVVRTLFSGVSRGTESLVFGGRIPESEYDRMRAPFQDGDFPAPVKYGYMNVGLVEHGPEALCGKRVFALYPHQTRYVIPAAWAHAIPDDLPPRRAVLAANMETALNGIWDARPHVGDRIAVVGAGTVGCLVAYLAARIVGCHVQLIDIDPARGATAAALGVLFATPENAERDVDLVLHASGTPAGLETALRLAALEAVIVELSWYGDHSVALPLGQAFHSRRLTIRSSQVGRLAPAQQPRWDARRRMALALDLLRDAALDVLLTGESPFEQLPETMARLAGGDGQPLCHVITY